MIFVALYVPTRAESREGYSRCDRLCSVRIGVAGMQIVNWCLNGFGCFITNSYGGALALASHERQVPLAQSRNAITELQRERIPSPTPPLITSPPLHSDFLPHLHLLTFIGYLEARADLFHSSPTLTTPPRWSSRPP